MKRCWQILFSLLFAAPLHAQTFSDTNAAAAAAVSDFKEAAARKKLALDAWDEKTGGIAAKFIPIPAGEFTMGNPETQDKRLNEVQHRVKLTHGFEMQATPVTRQQYFAVMEGKSADDDGDKPAEMSWFEAVILANKLSSLKHLKPAYLIIKNDRGNVLQVEITGANIYETEGYRLPTEAEWEYAARAGTPPNWPYFFGSNANGGLADYAWYKENSGGTTHPVATKRQNLWKLFDMYGNVSQWVQDDATNYPLHPLLEYIADPVNYTDSTNDGLSRGGDFLDDANTLRSCSRDSHSRNSNIHIGLRLVRTLK